MYAQTIYKAHNKLVAKKRTQDDERAEVLIQK
jgi:hypothetical protein